MKHNVCMNEMETKLEEARKWVEMLRSLADTIDVLAAVCNHQAEEGDGENAYLRPERDDGALRAVVAAALSEASRGGLHFLMRYKYQWYALYRELEQRGWIGRGQRGLSCFCRQMERWFPDARVGFDYKGVAKGGEHRHDPAYVQAERWFREKLR